MLVSAFEEGADILLRQRQTRFTDYQLEGRLEQHVIQIPACPINHISAHMRHPALPCPAEPFTKPTQQSIGKTCEVESRHHMTSIAHQRPLFRNGSGHNP
jgi:hypothetical protein